MIKKDMLIGEAVKQNPEIAEVFFEHGMHCLGCAVSFEEKIEEGCKAHGMDDAEIDKMIDEMNEKIKKEKEE